MTAILALVSGIALSASTGIRAFAPLWVLSVLARRGLLPLNASHAWVATDLAFYTLLTACVVELLVMAVPAVGSVVSWVGAFVKPFIGMYAASVVLAPELAPTLFWIAAIVVGAGATLPVAVATAAAHSAGDAGSGGLAAPLESVGETGSSIVLALGSVLAPLAALVGLVVLFLALRKARRYIGRRAAGKPRFPA